MDSVATRSVWKPLVVIAAIAFVYASVLERLGRFWWNDENYSHGLLIPFIIAFIFWSERGRLAAEPKRPSAVLGGAMIVLALLMLWVGTAGAEIFTQRTSLVVLLAGVTVYFWGARLLRFVAVPLLLLWLAIPIPAIIFNKIAFPLQLFASRCAVWAMRQFDIPVLRDGNVIELMPLNSITTKKLEVVEACSGIRSLMTLVTLAVVFAYFTSPDGTKGDGGRSNWSLRSWGFWRAAIIVLAAIPIAIITNAARVSGTGVLAHYYGTQVADGFFHSFSGWVVYIVAFLLLFAVGWLLDRTGASGRGGRGGSMRGRSRDKQADAALEEAARADKLKAEAGAMGSASQALTAAVEPETP
ncbi:MAG TPA: exosortase [Pyrinomonadaceae bacterium]|jgi:exosortase|nr:exosortase [Pyrinomonadaceae bacterium]